MRQGIAVITAAALIALGGSAATTASAERPTLKRCGTVVVRKPAGVSPRRVSGTLSARGLTCRTAKITVRSIARRYSSASSFVVRGNTFDCEGDGGELSCGGVRPGEDEPSIGFVFRPRRS